MVIILVPTQDVTFNRRMIVKPSPVLVFKTSLFFMRSFLTQRSTLRLRMAMDLRSGGRRVTIGVCVEDWNIFTCRWRVFNDGCGIAETSAAARLFQRAIR